MSVSGMSPAQIQHFLDEHQDAIIKFGIRFAKDAEATTDEEEYPEGEEPSDEDEDSNSVSLGMARDSASSTPFTIISSQIVPRRNSVTI